MITRATRFLWMSLTFAYLATTAIAVLPLAQAESAASQAKAPARVAASIESQNLRIEFDSSTRSRIIAEFSGKEIELGPFSTSEYVSGTDRSWSYFALASQKSERISDGFGSGEKLTVTGKSDGLQKTVAVTIYDNFPTLAAFDVSYTNTGTAKIDLLRWTNNAYTIYAQRGAPPPAFCSYQSGSYEKRPNWVLPLKAGFTQQNYLGMNASDYGGGTPIIDVWRRDVGIGIGHIEPGPRLISLPVSMPDANHAHIAVTYKHAKEVAAGESFHTLRTFVTVHQGDYFQTLTTYRKLMSKQGFQMAPPPEGAFGAIWCAWGYGRTVQLKQVYDTLPTAKKMGFAWVTLDDGWQNDYGDWQVDPKKFPNGDADMKALVHKIHAEGFKAQLWWSPLMASPQSKLLEEHPELALENKDGSRRKISWWDTDYLCPADQDVVENQEAIVRKILVDWGFDGLKLDGQHMNGVPECYNPAHHHKRPEESVEALPDFFKSIYDTAQKVKPGALVEFCPCGTAYSFFTMPHFNMSVASDPESSFQVRSKGKTLKGLMGDDIPYFGDHVELSDGGDDFASTMGVGGVVGTEFVLPSLVTKHGKDDLTPAREKEFTKWVGLYKEKMISRGQYLGSLYDIGFDVPEAHAIRKDNSMFYAFYAKSWKGQIELRGLDDRTYRVADYVNGKDYGVVHGPTAHLSAVFSKHLLLEADPK